MYTEDDTAQFHILISHEKPIQPFAVSTDDICWYQDQPLGAGESRIFACKKKLVGRYVVVSRKPTAPLHICEVEVYGQKAGEFFRFHEIRSGKVWEHTPEERVAASTLPRYFFGLRLAIAQADARPAMPASFR